MKQVRFRVVKTFPNIYKQHGYVKRKAPEHPYADKRGYVMDHRLVYEESIKKFLPKNAVIHHINGVRDDNRIENLSYFPEQSRHARFHAPGKRNPNGQFVAADPVFSEIKFRLLNKNTGRNQLLTLSQLIGTTFRQSQFEFRGRWTGLRDKNGKEIYEGDLVGNVGWKPGDWVAEVKWIRDFWGTGGGNYDDAGLYGDIHRIEVVGNIWEHPHLLKSHNQNPIYQNPDLLKEKHDK